MNSTEAKNLKNKIEKIYKTDSDVKHSYLTIQGTIRYNDGTFQKCSVQMNTEGMFDIDAILEKIDLKGVGAFSIFWDNSQESVTPKRISIGMGAGVNSRYYWSEEQFEELEKIGFKK